MALGVLKCLKLLKPSQLCNFGESFIANGSLYSCMTYVTNVDKEDNFEKLIESWNTGIKKQKTNKAMRVYLERAKQHDDFMKRQQISYQIGKRHLANMMGEDPESFTQDMVDEAIQYLFPSGLFDRAARPFLKPPETIFPPRKAAEFDNEGRPFHPFFYTGRPTYYKILFDVRQHMGDLKLHHNSLLIKRLPIDESTKMDVAGSAWCTQEEMQVILVEPISEIEYKIFLTAMERLIAMPYSNKVKDFINKYRKPLLGQKKALDIPVPLYDESGRAYVTTYECLRKSARGHVTIRSPGTGLIDINGQDISYFQDKQSREQILFPLMFTNMVNTVDVECYVDGGGSTGQSGALRWGIANSLRSFVDMEMVHKMRLAGLLTRDYRLKERKKAGQKGARKKFTWKKR
ncbi:mitochondrial ribosomal protein S9 [Arctopsyche grandis]|uniref:mitochondrial ribosomal protein S9 n=1 Tax=Arctopsyche grandis TaxID=121162 RepID=UPI00406D68EA